MSYTRCVVLPSVAYPLSENEESVFFNNSTAAALAGFRMSHIFTHLTDISKRQSVAKNHSQSTRPKATNGCSHSKSSSNVPSSA